MGNIIGIDLGTTKSVVGVWINGQPIIIPDRNGRYSIPSEILIQGDKNHQEVYVGWESRTKNKYQSDSFVVYAIKRMMGKTNYDREKWWYVYPQYAISYILAELKQMAEDYLHQEISDAIIAIPSHFDLNQRRATLEAAKIAGLNVINLLNEATASALTYFSKHPEEQIIAVIDIGGGTTDISVISGDDSFSEVLSIDGSTEIGGIDFSNLLNAWYLEKLKDKYDILPTSITKAVEVIIADQIEFAKKELTENTNSKIHLPYIQIDGKVLEEEFTITQTEFEKLSHHLVDQILELIKRTIKPYKINSFLLLGGASNTYGVKDRIINELNINPIKGVNIETAVAFGALIKSESLNKNSNTLFIDCLQDSYGIGVSGDVFEPFLFKDDKIPRIEMKEFVTTEPNQSSLLIKVYKGQSSVASKNKYLGSIEISNLPPAPKGEIILNVKFEVNSNMDFKVSASIKDHPKLEVTTILKSENGIPVELLNDMYRKVSIWKSKRKIR